MLSIQQLSRNSRHSKKHMNILFISVFYLSLSMKLFWVENLWTCLQEIPFISLLAFLREEYFFLIFVWISLTLENCFLAMNLDAIATSEWRQSFDSQFSFNSGISNPKYFLHLGFFRSLLTKYPNTFAQCCGFLANTASLSKHTV